MKDVAIAAGVSVSTVSHVLNGTRFVSEETTNRVNKTIRQLKFRSNSIARNLRSGVSRVIGFVASNIENYFFVNIARGIEKTVTAQGYQMILSDSAENKIKEMQNIESLYLRGVDGLIIAPTLTESNYLKNVLPPDFPLTFVNRQPMDPPSDCVLLNNTEASYDATRYLISRGNARIGFIAFHYGRTGIDKTITERLNGYKNALSEAKIRINPRFIGVTPGVPPTAVSKLCHAEPYSIMKNMLAASVQAVLCGNSLAAIGAYTCLKDLSIHIPDEMGLITFDDDLWLSMVTPRISVVAQPGEAMGAAAAARILKRIRGENPQHELLRLKAEIILRESC